MLTRLIYLYFIYLVLEGAFRKWLLPGFSQQLFLLKDLILAAGAFILVSHGTMYRGSNLLRGLSRKDIVIWGLWIFFFTGHLFVSGVTLTSIIGLRYYLIMLPILVLLPLAIRDMEHLNQVVLKYFYLAIPVCILGVVQFVSPASSRINAYAWTTAEMTVATIGEKSARITGTFSYIAPYAIYLQFMLLVGLCLYLNPRTAKERIIIAVFSLIILMNIAMTGSRAPFLIAVILATPLVLKVLRRKEIKQFSTVLSLLIIGCLLFFFADPFSLLAERHKGSGDATERIVGAMKIPLYTLQNVTLAGKGVGVTFGGLVEATGSQSDDYGFDEVNIDRLGVEVGVLGYLFILFVKFSYVLETFNFYRRIYDEYIKIWVLTSLMVQISMLWTIPVYNSVAAAYYFASLAIFFKMREFARIQVQPQ